MNRLIKTTAIILSLAAVFGCKKENPGEGSGENGQGGASIKGEYSINIVSPVELLPGDALSVFYSKTDGDVSGKNNEFTMPQIGSKAEGTLSDPLYEDSSYDWYVVYPYSADYESPANIAFSLGNQVQDGLNSDAHLTHMLAGVRKGIGASTMGPKVELQEVAPVLAIKVYNFEKEDFAISSIKVEADAAIGADGSFDLTSGKPVFSASDDSKEVTLQVKNASIKSNESATFYMTLAPCNASKLTITIGDITVETECSELVGGQTVSVDFATKEIPQFIKGITSSVDAAGNWHAALCPPYTLSGEFDLKDLFSKLPEGTITFELGPYQSQNSLVKGKYDDLKDCLADGHWNPNFAFGTAFNVDNADECGILFVMKKNGKALFNIYFSCVDPLASKVYMHSDKYHLSIPEIFADSYAEWGGGEYDACEAEYWQTIRNWETTMLQPGAHEVIHMGELFSDYAPYANELIGNPDAAYDPSSPIRWIYGLDGAWKPMEKWMRNFADIEYEGSNGEVIFFFNGKDLELTEYGKSLTRNSKGLYWIPAWTIMYSSARWNIPAEDRDKDNMNSEQPNGAYYGNLDGNPINGVSQYYDADAEKLRAERGIYIEDGILKTDENYTGIGFRMCPRLCFEYDYGTQVYIVGPRYIAHCFFNRYFGPATASDK